MNLEKQSTAYRYVARRWRRTRKPPLPESIQAHAPFIDRLLGNDQGFQPVAKTTKSLEVSLMVAQLRHGNQLRFNAA